MAWTAPRTWTTTELVTAAMMNTHVRDNLVYLGGSSGAFVSTSATAFTNTAFADMDALTAGPLASPLIVSVLTQTSALVTVSASSIVQATSGDCRISYRVSGATTVASNDNWSLRVSSASSTRGGSFVHHVTGLTVGTNTFEMQARVTANNATIAGPTLTVIPLTT